jgi:tetratricopeptide (TPR) repeat protein
MPRQNVPGKSKFIQAKKAKNEGNFQLAIILFKEAQQEGYNEPELKENLKEASLREAIRLISNNSSSEKDFEQSRDLFDEIIGMGMDIGEIYYNKAVANIYLSQFNEAKANLQIALDRGYKNFNCYYNMGIVCKKLNKKEEAERFLKHAYDLNNEDKDALYNYGVILSANQSYTEAKQIFEKLLQMRGILDSLKVRALCEVSKVLKSQEEGDNREEVLNILNQAEPLLETITDQAKRDGYSSYIFSALGALHSTKNDILKAENYFEKALAIRINDQVIASNLGFTYDKHAHMEGLPQEQKISLLEKAIEAFKKAPLNSDAQENLACIYEELGRKDDAAIIYGKLSSLMEDGNY